MVDFWIGKFSYPFWRERLLMISLLDQNGCQESSEIQNQPSEFFIDFLLPEISEEIPLLWNDHIFPYHPLALLSDRRFSELPLVGYGLVFWFLWFLESLLPTHRNACHPRGSAPFLPPLALSCCCRGTCLTGGRTYGHTKE